MPSTTPTHKEITIHCQNISHKFALVFTFDHQIQSRGVSPSFPLAWRVLSISEHCSNFTLTFDSRLRFTRTKQEESHTKIYESMRIRLQEETDLTQDEYDEYKFTLPKKNDTLKSTYFCANNKTGAYANIGIALDGHIRLTPIINFLQVPDDGQVVAEFHPIANAYRVYGYTEGQLLRDDIKLYNPVWQVDFANLVTKDYYTLTQDQTTGKLTFTPVDG